MTSSPPKLTVRNLSKSFGSTPVLKNIDLDLHAGESLVIIGGSGTGKSVLIKCLLGLIQPDRGTIKIDGKDLSSVSKQDRRQLRSQIGMLFQGGALFDSLPVWENITFALLHAEKIHQKLSTKKAKALAIELLESVHLKPEIANRYPAELSGGMQKRVALARAIANQPKILFFDEPTTGLDPIVANSIDKLIIEHVRQLGASAITITHDIRSLQSIADRVALLFEGHIVWQGTLEEMNKTDDPYINQFIHGKADGPLTV